MLILCIKQWTRKVFAVARLQVFFCPADASSFTLLRAALTWPRERKNSFYPERIKAFLSLSLSPQLCDTPKKLFSCEVAIKRMGTVSSGFLRPPPQGLWSRGNFVPFLSPYDSLDMKQLFGLGKKSEASKGSHHRHCIIPLETQVCGNEVEFRTVLMRLSLLSFKFTSQKLWEGGGLGTARADNPH